VAIPLPQSFAETQGQLAASQRRYLELARERRQVRLTYMTILMALTGLVLFVQHLAGLAALENSDPAGRRPRPGNPGDFQRQS